MLILRLIAVLAWPALGGASRGFFIPRQADNTSSDPLSNSTAAPVAMSFIVEYVPGQGSVSSDPNITVQKTFDSDVFSGAAIETDSYNVDSLQALPQIARVWPNSRILLDPLKPLSFSNDGGAANYTTHNATGVSKLHDRGIFGKGAVVGVVDTGTWYQHPALGGCFGKGCKIAGGYDFVGNGLWPYEDPTPDKDPEDQIGHGTHVAGIIGGKSDFWVGVAPEATIFSYKVFAQLDSTDEATLIEAFVRAYEDGCDIITASIGGASGWSTGAWAEVASRLVDEGVVVTIAAGNSGAAGPFFPSSGSSGEKVLAVASVETEKLPASPFLATFTLDGISNSTKVGYLPSTYYFPVEVAGWPIVPMNLDISVVNDACTAYPSGTPSLAGKIPLVRRGTCTFTTKQQNLAALGAKYILIYNNKGALVTPSTTDDNTLIALISAEAGEAIVGTVAAGGNVTGDFSINPEEVVGLNYAAGGRPNTYTSWGGLYDLQIKPDIAAPGGDIFSTYLDDTYAVLSGTSMATPYVAGVAALYISAKGGRSVHGKKFANMLRQRIIASGTSLPWSDGTSTEYGFVAPVAQVGTGMIDAFKMVNYTTSIAFEKMALNDTAHFERYHSVTVTNKGAAAVKYALSVENGAGVESAGWFELPPTTGDKRLKSFSELEPIKLAPKVSLPRSFTLAPGRSKTVSVNFGNPNTLGWNASALPLYGGKVLVSASNGERWSIPFMGLAANLKSQMNPIYRATYPFSQSTNDLTDIRDKAYYTFNLSLFGSNAQDFPKVYVKLIWGTRQIRWDIFKAGWSERNWVYPPVEGRNGYIGPATCWVGAGQVSSFDPDLYDANQTFTYPVIDIPRSTEESFDEYWWFGKLGNGSQIEPGNYTMRFAALKPFGNPARSDNWDVFKVPQIKILGKY